MNILMCLYFLFGPFFIKNNTKALKRPQKPQVPYEVSGSPSDLSRTLPLAHAPQKLESLSCCIQRKESRVRQTPELPGTGVYFLSFTWISGIFCLSQVSERPSCRRSRSLPINCTSKLSPGYAQPGAQIPQDLDKPSIGGWMLRHLL